MPRRGATTATTTDVYEYLRRKIVRGEYVPEQHLPAADIAAELGVSRTPVREALHILEREGLVVGQHNRGWSVRPLTRDGIASLWQLRAALEGFGARKAAENVDRLDAEQIRDLEHSISELDRLIEHQAPGHLPERVEQMMHHNSRIHDIIIDLGSAPQLRSFIASTVDRGVLYQAWDLFSAAQRRKANFYHRLIVEQVLAGKPDRAGALMHAHVMETCDNVLQHIDAAGGDVGAVIRRKVRLFPAQSESA